MRYSRMFIPTLKETPAEAEVISHKLMLRAGMIRKLAAGIYNLLPLGLIVIKKIEAIVRDELKKAGCQEILMPAVQPAELWTESKRWDEYGKELLRFKDRHDREFCFGPTHEEVVTDIVRREIKSYRQLPINLFQIQTKFRDEIRPRFGLMRGREFIMKDGYSFDCNEEGTKKTYKDMHEAYCNIFRRCGLDFRAVEADTGNIGGSFSHEFVVLASSGEDDIASCDSCKYAANIEKAVSGAEHESDISHHINMKEMALVDTPSVKSVDEVCSFFNASPEHLLKTLIFKTDDNKYIAVLIRGDYEVNQVKLKNILGCKEALLAEEDDVKRLTGAPAGFSGPVGLQGIRMIADYSIKSLKNFITGANQADKHYTHVNMGRDFNIEEFFDLRKVVDEDRCPLCSGRLKLHRSIEVGHIFILGDKYSRLLNAKYLDENGREQVINMGCYGIGIGRTMAASIEQNNDDNGIIWPLPLAPFKIIVVPVNTNDKEVVSLAEKIYADLTAQGEEVLIDDREISPGVKFKDADLIGIPFQVIIGSKNMKNQEIEIKIRRGGEKILVKIEEFKEMFKKYLAADYID